MKNVINIMILIEHITGISFLLLLCITLLALNIRQIKPLDETLAAVFGSDNDDFW